MSLSFSVVGSKRSVVRPGLSPDRLRAAGILTDPTTPDGAYRRARGLVGESLYRQARALLLPHVHAAPPILRPQLLELLGLCCARSGGDWQSHLSAALSHHEQHRDIGAQARILRHLGEIAMMQGRLGRAIDFLTTARRHYAAVGDARIHQVTALQGRVALRAGDVRTALPHLENALEGLIEAALPRTEALARLDRARALAALGDAGTSARELLAAERLLASSGDRSDHLRSRLARAETLLILGERERAARGLLRLYEETTGGEDLFLRATVHQLLGQAIGTADAASARRHLMRGSHHFRALGSDLGVATCQMWLARMDAAIGLNPRGRLYGLTLLPLEEWPGLVTELALVEAEIAWGTKSVTRLERARASAIKIGQRTLTRRIDALLSAHGHTLQDVTPLGDEAAAQRPRAPRSKVPHLQRIEDDGCAAHASGVSAVQLPPRKEK